MRALCVFCGSSNGRRPEYRDAAVSFGTLLAERDIELVYGGASVGLMGALADAVLTAGGRVSGVIPAHLVDREVAHPGITDLHVTESMHARKALMADLADGFAALPGGFGTLEEFAEITTWAQLGLHRKPIGLLNVTGFFDLLLQFADHLVTERFVPAAHRDLLVTADAPAVLLDKLAGWQPACSAEPADGAPAR